MVTRYCIRPCRTDGGSYLVPRIRELSFTHKNYIYNDYVAHDGSLHESLDADGLYKTIEEAKDALALLIQGFDFDSIIPI